MSIKNKPIDNKGNELSSDIQIDSLSSTLKKLIDMLLEDIFIEYLEELQSIDRSTRIQIKTF